MKMKYIPNILSVVRIILVFVFVGVFFTYPDKPIIAVLVFLASGVTDVVDGRLARHFGWVTQVGKILDPVADKLMQCTALLCLAIKEYVPVWIFVFFMVKELSMGLGAILFFKRNREIGMSRFFGKFAVVLFYASVVTIVMLGESIGSLGVNVICVVTAVVAASALVFYYRAYLKAEELIKKSPRAAGERQKSNDLM